MTGGCGCGCGCWWVSIEFCEAVGALLERVILLSEAWSMVFTAVIIIFGLPIKGLLRSYLDPLFVSKCNY